MSFSAKQVTLVVNQDAGRVPARMKLLRKLSKKHKLKLNMCDGPDVDNEIRRALQNKSLKRLIIGGGDGTVSATASLVSRLRPEVEIAVLPLGTANYYAKTLGVDRSLKTAFDIALGEKTEKRHLCRANRRDFLIGVNIGTTSRMLKEVTDEEKQRFGKIAYLRGIVRTLRKAIPPDVEIIANGETHSYSSTELVVINQHIPERVRLMPEVKGSEAYFEIITYGLGNSKLSPLFAVVIFALTLGHNQKYLKRIKATKATIRTSKPQPVAIDGDSLEQTPLEVKLLKEPVVFVCA